MTGFDDLKHAYARDGYAIARQCVSHEALDSVIDGFRKLVAQQNRYLGAPASGKVGVRGLAEECQGLIERDLQRYFATSSLAQNLPEMFSLASSEAIIALVRGLGLETPAFLARIIMHNQSALLSSKVAAINGYHLLSQHQDWRAMQGSLDALTIWVPLHDVGRDNYPLAVVPGSHRLGLLGAFLDQGNVFALREDAKLPESDFEVLEMQKGDVLVLSGFVVHRSHATPDMTGPRFAVGARFNNASEPSFIERNYPSRHKMSLDPRIDREDWPGPDDLRQLFDAETQGAD